MPQRHLEQRILLQHAGKAFGAGSAVNSRECPRYIYVLFQVAAVCGKRTAGWVRGDSNDYEAWAKLVNDPKWNYKGFLPYFRKTEHYHDTAANLKEHGLEGPIHTAPVTSSGRKFPLRQRVQEVWATAAVQGIWDAKSCSPQGQ